MQVIAILDRTGGNVSYAQMQTVAQAVSQQVQTDLAKAWNVSAQVVALSDPSQLTPGTWPVYIVTTLEPDEGGVHYDSNNQPFALVEAGEAWSLSASHEICEMLVDPSGNGTRPANAIGLDASNNIIDVPGTYQYIVEICDPCEAQGNAYYIGSVIVSDFYLPNFFDATPTPGAFYSNRHKLLEPRRILPGGYISWLNPVTNTIQQMTWFNAVPQLVDLGSVQQAQQPMRVFIDSQTRPPYPLSTFGPYDDMRSRAREISKAHERDRLSYSTHWEKTIASFDLRSEL